MTPSRAIDHVMPQACRATHSIRAPRPRARHAAGGDGYWSNTAMLWFQSEP
jgi:hypothetical protein